jgi:hypothetical protein
MISSLVRILVLVTSNQTWHSLSAVIAFQPTPAPAARKRRAQREDELECGLVHDGHLLRAGALFSPKPPNCFRS